MNCCSCFDILQQFFKNLRDQLVCSAIAYSGTLKVPSHSPACPGAPFVKAKKFPALDEGGPLYVCQNQERLT